MSELITGTNWIHDVLAADATIISAVGARIYDSLAPKGSAFPYILIQVTDTGADLMVVDANRVWTESLWLVRVIGQIGSFSTLETIDDRIDTLLHRQSGGNVLACVREQPFVFTETLDGIQYRHLGGIYRLYVQ